MIYLVLIALLVVIILQAQARFLDRRRMDVLRKLNTPSNPRFGVDHRLTFSLEQLRQFFDADSGIFLLQNEDGSGYTMRQVNRKDACLQEEAAPLPLHLAELLMSFPSKGAAMYRAPLPYWKWDAFRCYDVTNNQTYAFEKSAARKVGAYLGAHYMTIPLVFNNKTLGRIFMVSQGRPFRRNDVDFVSPITNQFIATMKNMEAVTRLADEAADEERKRIARDIHDSIIQPYIGLQLAIAVLRQKIMFGEDNNLLRDIDQLDRMCNDGTQELRAYINKLRNGNMGEAHLLPAVQRFVSKFTMATGIDVKVESSPNFSIHDALASHVFHMAIEGLSNVHRHTQSESAAIRLGCDKERLLLQIENSGAENGGTTLPQSSQPPQRTSFTPRSISERAHSLGGTVHVETHPNGRAVISIDIPL